MCGAHHKLIDAPENAHLHTVESLMELKAQHESEARAGGRRATTLSAEQIAVLLESSTRYEDWSIHNDFRQALFKVGGEGGGLGGGGGGGGILTLVGTNRAPASVELDGQAGRAPGAGGGGGGATVFIGRPIDSDDLAVGLRLSSLFLANYGNYSDTLLNVLGAGWSNLLLQTLPCSVKLLLALVLDLGEVEPSTLLRLKVQVVAPSGSQATEQVADIAVPDSVDLVKRATRLVLLDFDIAEFGKWTIEVHSSAHRLGIYEFECRHSIQHQ